MTKRRSDDVTGTHSDFLKKQSYLEQAERLIVANRILLFFSITLITLSCVDHDLIKHVDCTQSDLTLTVDSVQNATRCSADDGVIYTSAHGGEPPYLYWINNERSQESPWFTNRPSGIYTITVRDNNGCEATIDNITLLANDFHFTAVVTGDSSCVNHNGSILITVDGGNPPFSYKLGNGSFSGVNSFTGLKTGTYAITIKDNTDCAVALYVTVPRRNTGASWTNDILPILKTSCAISGCHDGKTRFNYRDYQTAKRDAAQIKARTEDGSMPFDGTPLPQNQIDLIACWVDDGAPEN